MSVYFDHNATSPLHPEVLEAMMPYLRNPVANASSLHSAGRLARSAIETARAQVAELLNTTPDSVIFTSGGSEANNLVLKGFIDFADPRPIISTGIEHPSIIEPLKQLEKLGQKVIHLPVNSDGEVDLAEAQAILQQHSPKLLSVMLANNETGVIQPVKALAELVSDESCLKHSDVIQMAGKLPVDIKALGVDAVSLAAHKLQGPQGIGALVVRNKPKQPLISGGAQEKYKRAGTESVAMIVGMGKAAQLAALEIDDKRHHINRLRSVFESKLSAIPGVVVFGEEVDRLPNTTYFSIPYYHGETLLMELDKAGFALSSGSACHSEVTRASHVLQSMGVEDQLALNAIRVSLGTGNDVQQINALINRLETLINKLPAIIRQAAI
ncbi:MAG: cysteine desulfurase [Gammaproteobacteria bacterium]|nr:cysteine desulfurase [Gammaproteobacteria bacterium]